MKDYYIPRILCLLVFILCMTPFFSPAYALIAGLLFSLGGLRLVQITRHSSSVLKASIVMIGFGMSLEQVLSVSKTGFLLTGSAVILVLACGLFLGSILKVEKRTSLLISAGTAICGGSAIAAIAPIIQARGDQVSVSLMIVFILNGLALIAFPWIGSYVGLSQEAFGYWAAIAIHDTSSVVGAGTIFGDEALQVATTVKLIRTLWLIPLSIIIACIYHKKGSGRIPIPWFIILFAAAILITNLVPGGQPLYGAVHWFGKKGLMMAIFLIGAGVSFTEARQAGPKCFMMGIPLWLMISLLSLLFVSGFMSTLL